MNITYRNLHIGIILLTILIFTIPVWAESPGTATTEPAAHAVLHLSPSLRELDSVGGGLTLKIMITLIQFAVVLVLAKLCGAAAEKIKIPGVLGELVAGVIIGPFALGSYIPIPAHGLWVPLFPAPGGPLEWPLSDPFWLIATMASVMLLFMAGLHTNLKQFLTYLGPASVVAVGGVVLPFFFGSFMTSYFAHHVWHEALEWYSPQALFVGAIMVATSVGITARVLSDIKRLDTPEGVTILGAAVVDDVLGILVLAIVAAVSKAETTGGQVAVGQIGIIAVKAFGFWLGLTFIGMAAANHIERLFNKIRYAGARLGLALALVLLCSAVAEIFGLAFIIGAYSIGLALSKTKMAHQLIDDLKPINDFIVPIFFAAMGMLVNFSAMTHSVGFGATICVLAIFGKVFGCGIPSLFTGFNVKGAYRIGVGMLPRGEVALILAGVGLVNGYINSSIFGVSILITLVTTIIAPLLLVPAFKIPGPGVRRPTALPAEETPSVTYSVALSENLCRLFVQVLLNVAEQVGYAIKLDESEQGIYLLQKNGAYLSVVEEKGTVRVHTTSRHENELTSLVQEVEKRIITAVENISP